MTTHVMSTECPECAAQVGFARAPLYGEIARCGDCGVEMEVTSASPIAVVVAPPVQEDWGSEAASAGALSVFTLQELAGDWNGAGGCG